MYYIAHGQTFYLELSSWLACFYDKQKKNKQTNKSKHSIWFSRIYKILYFIQFYPPQTTIPHDPSSKLYFRMWNYYCGKLQLCWKLYCQPVKYKKKCTKCMMYEWSKYHIILLHTTVSELLSELWKNSDLKRNQNHSWKWTQNSKQTKLICAESENWYINVCNIFLFSLQLNCCLRITLIIKPIGRKKYLPL